MTASKIISLYEFFAYWFKTNEAPRRGGWECVLECFSLPEGKVCHDMFSFAGVFVQEGKSERTDRIIVSRCSCTFMFLAEPLGESEACDFLDFEGWWSKLVALTLLV